MRDHADDAYVLREIMLKSDVAFVVIASFSALFGGTKSKHMLHFLRGKKTSNCVCDYTLYML